MTKDDINYIEELENKINKLEKAVRWLSNEVANNNTFIGKLNGEIKTNEDCDSNRDFYYAKIEKILN
jgi:peptidoglycan hydrolase CwlO-like protein